MALYVLTAATTTTTTASGTTSSSSPSSTSLPAWEAAVISLAVIAFAALVLFCCCKGAQKKRTSPLLLALGASRFSPRPASVAPVHELSIVPRDNSGASGARDRKNSSLADAETVSPLSPLQDWHEQDDATAAALELGGGKDLPAASAKGDGGDARPLPVQPSGYEQEETSADAPGPEPRVGRSTHAPEGLSKGAGGGGGTEGDEQGDHRMADPVLKVEKGVGMKAPAAEGEGAPGLEPSVGRNAPAAPEGLGEGGGGGGTQGDKQVDKSSADPVPHVQTSVGSNVPIAEGEGASSARLPTQGNQEVTRTADPAIEPGVGQNAPAAPGGLGDGGGGDGTEGVEHDESIYDFPADEF